MFKIPDTARRHTADLTDFETRCAMPLNASNIAVLSRGARNPTPPSQDPSPDYSRQLRQTPLLPPRAPACTYVIEYVSRWLTRSLIPRESSLSLSHLSLPSPPPLSWSLARLLSAPYAPSLLDPDGNPDRIRVICGGTLSRPECRVTSRFSPSSGRVTPAVLSSIGFSAGEARGAQSRRR